MMIDEKYNDPNLFIEEERTGDKLRKEENNQENRQIENKEPSEQIKNANAAGMGALERSNENQIKFENQADQQTGEAVY
jgi:hypothetical protein